MIFLKMGSAPSEICINTQNMTNPTIESPVKMEYERNFSISGVKMMMKSGLGKICTFDQNSVIKMTW